jgi:hypothetical protein
MAHSAVTRNGKRGTTPRRIGFDGQDREPELIRRLVLNIQTTNISVTVQMTDGNHV